MTFEIIEAATRVAYNALHHPGAWDNPGTLPDEIDRDGWRSAISKAMDAVQFELGCTVRRPAPSPDGND